MLFQGSFKSLKVLEAQINSTDFKFLSMISNKGCKIRLDSSSTEINYNDVSQIMAIGFSDI